MPWKTLRFTCHFTTTHVAIDETVVRSFLNKHFLMGFLCKFILLCVSWTRRSVSNDHLEKKSFVSHCVLLRQCGGGVGPTSPMILIITYFHTVFWCESFYRCSWPFGTYLMKLNEIKLKPFCSQNARNGTTFWDGLWDKRPACQKQLLVGLHDMLCRSMWNWFACVCILEGTLPIYRESYHHSNTRVVYSSPHHCIIWSWHKQGHLLG